MKRRGRSGNAWARPDCGRPPPAPAARRSRRFILPPVLPNLPRHAKVGQRQTGTKVARDGQGLEVSNAGAEAIASLDFLRDEWLAFGNRLAEVVRAAHQEGSGDAAAARV